MPAPSHFDMQIAMRTRLLTLVVATTGTTTLSATATGYARTAGSFLTDGFAEGMEIAPGGFTQTAPGVIDRGLTATAMPIVGGRTVQAAASGRSLVVGLPGLRAWENLTLTRDSQRPYVEEQYIPGPAFITEVGSGGRQELRPMYSPRVYVSADTGIKAGGKYADALLSHFIPGTLLTCANGVILCVRDVPAPAPGQRLPGVSVGWSCIPVTIAFHTLN